ncbi:MAG: hypothetical protein IKP04_00540 [Candidatus Methanomethylophilaceae archaeon]|nr:hypothetical protein [Candidatus Methanomethylophilaceae archaeon]
MNQGNPKALLPILIFVILYLGMGIILEYGMGISMGFYSIPVLMVFLIALAVAYVQTKGVDRTRSSRSWERGPEIPMSS